MKYVCLDTNIFLDAVFDRNKNEYTEIIKAIKELLDCNMIKLILPEIIEIEFLRHYKDEILTIKNNVAKIKNYIVTMSYPSELREYREKAVTSLREMIDKFEEEKYEFETTEVFKIFSHKNTVKIKLNECIIFRAYKRSFLKLKPNGDNFFSGDNSIVESLIYFSENSNKEEIDFLTRNYKDFGCSKLDKDKIHKDLAEEFKENNINYVYDILEYLHKLNKAKNVNILPETDKRKYFIVCPRCKYMGESKWVNVCEKCGYVWDGD